MKKNTKTLIIVFVLLYVLILNIVPLVFQNIKENISYGYDYYYHVIGANQIKSSGTIPFNDDNRNIWSDNSSLYYPPGFMIIIADISLLTGINILYLPAIFIIINWIIFLLFVYLLAKLFCNNDEYTFLAVIFGLFFISGSIYLGFSYLVPPNLGCFFIWICLLILFNEKLTIYKKISLLVALITILIVLHRPSAIVWIMIVASIIIISLITRLKTIKESLIAIFSTVTAILLSYIIYLRMIFSSNSTSLLFLYNLNVSLLFKILLIFIFILLVIVCLIKIINSFNFQFLKYIHTLKYENKLVYVSLIVSVLFFIVISIPFIKFVASNISLSMINDIHIISNIWNLLVTGNYSYLRSTLYILHIGILTVILFLPSIFIKNNNQKFKFAYFIPLILIVLTFIAYAYIQSGDKRPERIFLYIVPFMIIGSVVTFQYLFNRIGNKYKIYLIILLVLNLLISTYSNIAVSHALVKDSEISSMIWISNNLGSRIIYSQGYFDIIGNALNMDMQSLYGYTANSINTIYNNKNQSSKIYILNSPNKQVGAIKGLDNEIINNAPKYDILYSNGNEILIVKESR